MISLTPQELGEILTATIAAVSLAGYKAGTGAQKKRSTSVEGIIQTFLDANTRIQERQELMFERISLALAGCVQTLNLISTKADATQEVSREKHISLSEKIMSIEGKVDILLRSE
jgi:hypothetical protein